MGKAIQAIYEHGVLRPLEQVDLGESQLVRITIQAEAGGERTASETSQADPLEGVRVDTGLPDLAERFDDYRFGRP